MKNLKNYLQTQLSITELKLKSIITEIENIPDPSKINISLYGTREELQKEYSKKHKPNIIKRIIGPSNQEIQKYVRKKELERLQKEKSILERKINQIKATLPVLTENGITGQIWPNEQIIKLILDYASNNNINPKEILELLVQLCKNSIENDRVEDKIKRNIARFFNENNKIESDTELNTIILLFEKLFIITLNNEELTQYRIVIEQIITQLKIDKNTVNKKQSKEELEAQRQALIELQDYINGTTIIKTLDTKTFKTLLDKTNIERDTKEYLIKQMEQSIQEENERHQIEQTQEAMRIFLTEEEIELVTKAELKENTLMGPLKDLLHRAKKDVISMCKYLSYFEGVTDMHEAIEILSDRTRVLKHVLLQIEEENKERNTLFYITDKEGVPIFLRNLELYSISEYNNIYNLLYKVSSNTQGKRLCTKQDIEFYYIGNKNIKVVYTTVRGYRVIIGIDSKQPPHPIKTTITQDTIDKIREIEHRAIHPTFQEIHTTYENVILEALNIQETGYALTLKKKED